MKKIIMTLIFIFLSTGIFATDYWVAKTGNNGNTGADSSNAWLTIAYAHTQISNTDTIYICNGWYNESNIGLTAGVGFSMFGRGSVYFTGGVICSTWTAAASPAYYSDEVTNVNTSGVYFDTTIQLAVATDSANCVATDSSYYFASNRLFVNLPSGVDPASHRIEVSTETSNYLLYASYTDLDGEKIYIRNITFSLSEGTAISLSGASTVAPDSLIFDSCVFRNNSGATTIGAAARIVFDDGGTPSAVKYLEYNDCYFWANYVRGDADGFDYDWPGTLTFNRCYFGNNTDVSADFFDVRDYAETDITYTANFLNCVFYRNYTTGEDHALISMSCDYNKFDSCLFMDNSHSVDGGITFQECDSSHISYCAFIENVSNGDGGQGSISATISSAHPGEGHILYIAYNRIIDCWADETDNEGASLGPYIGATATCYLQHVHYIGNYIIGGTSGYGLHLQDADEITMRTQSGNKFYDITDPTWYWSHCDGNNISPYVAVYDTTADDTTAVTTVAEDSVFVLFSNIGNDYNSMDDYWTTYWLLRSPNKKVPFRK